jgi:hypothetical protein
VNGNPDKIKPIVTKPKLPCYNSKAQIDLISSEICDVVDEIQTRIHDNEFMSNTSPKEVQGRPKYLKYVREIHSSKPKDSEISTAEKLDHLTIDLNLKDSSDSKENKRSNSRQGQKKVYKRSSTSMNKEASEDNQNIDDSILQAYQILSQRKYGKPTMIKPASKKFSNECNKVRQNKNNHQRKSMANDNKHFAMAD